MWLPLLLLLMLLMTMLKTTMLLLMTITKMITIDNDKDNVNDNANDHDSGHDNDAKGVCMHHVRMKPSCFLANQGALDPSITHPGKKQGCLCVPRHLGSTSNKCAETSRSHIKQQMCRDTSLAHQKSTRPLLAIVLRCNCSALCCDKHESSLQHVFQKRFFHTLLCSM